MSFAGYDHITGFADLAAWCNLLSAGNAAYVASPLTYFRIHAEQGQNQPGAIEKGRNGLIQLHEGAYRLGLTGKEPEIAASMILPMGDHPVYMNADIARLTCLAELDASDWRIYDRLGDYAAKMDDLPLAISWYKRAEEKNERGFLGSLKLIRLLVDLNQFSEAIPLLERYLERRPDDGDAQEYLSRARDALETLKNHAESISVAPLLDYWRWCERRLEDPLIEVLHRERFERLWKKETLFEIILLLKPGQEALLADSIDSLARQHYSGWRLAIFAQSASPEAEFKSIDSPVRWIECPPEEIAERVSKNLAESPAHWFGFFECGTRFPENALLTLGDYIAARPEWALIYADDDYVAANGKFHSPRFKPDLNLEFLRSFDYVGNFFIEKHAALAAGGFAAIPGAGPYDFLLRAIDASGEAAVGHIPEILAHLSDSLPQGADNEGAVLALKRHFARRKTPVDILPGGVPGETRRVVYRHEETPKVSIIIPTKNRLDLLHPCIESLVKKTFYSNWELVIVDNGSDDPNVGAYYEELRALLRDRLKILDAPGGFDFSAMNNRAARKAEGDYLLLLNNDTECIHGEWLDAMMAHARRPDVGIVGARLLYPKTLKLQHAGAILGLGQLSTANHVFPNVPHDAPSYMNRTFVDQEYSAVTGACLLIRASLFHQAAGLEPRFKILHQDIDLCLKVRDLGYRVIWTPFATLIHHRSGTAKYAKSMYGEASAARRETELFHARWKSRLYRDPAWNRNLTLRTGKPRLEIEYAVPWNVDFHDRPRILFMPAPRPALTEYRGGGSLRALNAQGRLHYAAPEQSLETPPTIVEIDRLAPDALLMYSPIDDSRYRALLQYKMNNPDVFRIYSIDDLLNRLPDNHSNHPFLPPEEVTKRFRIGLEASHRLIVSTAPLAEAFRGMIDDIRIVPNAIEDRIWGRLRSKRRHGEKPRIGWAGAQQHARDLAFISEVVKATRQDVEWVFFGMITEELRPHVAEFHDFHYDFSTYPEKLALLDLDLAIAPLEICAFNEAKSNLHLLEFGILGYPVVCTDIFPYRTDDPPVTRLPNVPKKWIAAIRERIADLDALAREGDALREWVRKNYLLENRLDEWMSAFSTT
jgi:GT2 family glycosyltransferase